MHTLLVIPCYRERARLPQFLPVLCEALVDLENVTVLVSDDGSGAAEQAWLAGWVEEQRTLWPFLEPALLSAKNTGKGGAVYAGWAAARPEVTHLAFVDADGAVPPAEVARLLAAAADFPDKAVYAVRTGADGTRVERTTGRRIAGLVFRFLVRLLFRFPLPDTQCGGKVMPRVAWEAVKGDLRERRFCFDIELTARILSGGTEIVSLPVNWSERPGSRMQAGSAAAMFASVWALRRRLGDWRKRRPADGR